MFEEKQNRTITFNSVLACSGWSYPDFVISRQADSIVIVADHRANRSSNIHHVNKILDFPSPLLASLLPYILPLLNSELRPFKNLLEPFLMSEKRHWQGLQDHIKRMYYTPCVISLFDKIDKRYHHNVVTLMWKFLFFDEQIRLN